METRPSRDMPVRGFRPNRADPGRLLVWDSGFLMHAVSDVLLDHLSRSISAEVTWALVH
jgi:hypothetical protein